MFCQISGTVITEILCLAKCIRPFHQLVSFPETVSYCIAFRICRSNYISGMVVDVTLSLTICTHDFRRTSPHIIYKLCGFSHAIRCTLHISGSIIGEILCASSGRCDTGITTCQIIIKLHPVAFRICPEGQVSGGIITAALQQKSFRSHNGKQTVLLIIMICISVCPVQSIFCHFCILICHDNGL